MHWKYHSEGLSCMLSTFSIIPNEFSASLKHNSAKSTITIFVNLLMASYAPHHPLLLSISSVLVGRFADDSAVSSSVISIRISNPIPTSNLLPFSTPSSSLSISPPSWVRPSPFHPSREIHRARSSPPPASCTRIFWSPCSPRSSRC